MGKVNALWPKCDYQCYISITLRAYRRSSYNSIPFNPANKLPLSFKSKQIIKHPVIILPLY